MSYSPDTEWPVEFTDEFETWWESLTEAEQEDVAAKVMLDAPTGCFMRSIPVGARSC